MSGSLQSCLFTCSASNKSTIYLAGVKIKNCCVQGKAEANQRLLNLHVYYKLFLIILSIKININFKQA
jgi:hypothetical protein